MHKDLVSVIIPTFNRPITLERAINSVLNQTYAKLEVIIVDDNNPNTEARVETEQLMKKYEKNSKVKYVKHEYNKNGSAARNTGFKHSSGEFIMFLDDDDEFLPCKAEVQVKCLKEHDFSWGACYTKYKRIKDGKIDTVCGESREGNLYFDELCRNLFIQAGSNLMVRREAFESIGGFNEKFQRNQDIEFAVRLLKRYKLAYVDEMGLIYHRYMLSEKKKFDMEKITKYYLENFKEEISNLTIQDKKRFYNIINLQLFRYKIIVRKDIKSGLAMLFRREVTILNAIRYFFHLLRRKILKKSYGFRL